ncbi:MAG: tetratricopeptide repeat protein [Planctomycetota bacterium]
MTEIRSEFYRRFIGGLLVALTVFGFVIAFQIYGLFAATIVFVLVSFVFFRFCIRCVHWIRRTLATWLVPLSWPRKPFGLIHRLCGKRYTASALFDHGVRLRKSGRIEEATHAFDQVLSLDKSPSDYWAQRGVAHYEANRFVQAESDLTMAIKRDWGNETAYTYRGYAKLSLGKFTDAIDDLDRVICQRNVHSKVAYFRGYANELLGHWQQAFDDYTLAYDLRATELLAELALARLQACSPDDSIRDGAKAIENARRICVRTAWKDWIPISVLAAAHAEANDFQKAIEFEKQALELAPNPEKPERQKRIDQFQSGKPARLSHREPKHA